MLKCLKGFPVTIAAALLSVSAVAADLSAPDSITAVKSDGSYVGAVADVVEMVGGVVSGS